MTIPLLDFLLLRWHRWQTRRKMQRVFGRGADPFRYRSSRYEAARLEAMDACLDGRRYGLALEVGCAEGDFTERLSRRAGAVVALDLSAAALSRARARFADSRVEFVEADVRDWEPPGGERYDLIVLGDVLYYLDKPLVRRLFRRACRELRSWLAPGGRLVLAHGFAGASELEHRRGFSRRFESLGLVPISERIVEGGAEAGGVSCLVSVLQDPERPAAEQG